MESDSAMIESPTNTPPVKAPVADRQSRKPRVMDFRPSKALAAGIKRVGGRSGVARLGASASKTSILPKTTRNVGPGGY